MSSLAGESNAVNDRVGQRRISALREIQELTTADLTHPDVEWAVAIGQEGHELAVRGDGGVEFRAFPVGEAAEASAFQGVLPEEVARLQPPAGDPERDEKTVAAIAAGTRKRHRMRP